MEFEMKYNIQLTKNLILYPLLQDNTDSIIHLLSPPSILLLTTCTRQLCIQRSLRKPCYRRENSAMLL